MIAAEENIKVAVRIRPIQRSEQLRGEQPCVKSIREGKEVQVQIGTLDAQVYRCSSCFPPDASQASFFEASGITDLLDSAMQGYRACTFAYGQVSEKFFAEATACVFSFLL
jgi:hypothetical protein